MRVRNRAGRSSSRRSTLRYQLSGAASSGCRLARHSSLASPSRVELATVTCCASARRRQHRAEQAKHLLSDRGASWRTRRTSPAKHSAGISKPATPYLQRADSERLDRQRDRDRHGRSAVVRDGAGLAAAFWGSSSLRPPGLRCRCARKAVAEVNVRRDSRPPLPRRRARFRSPPPRSPTAAPRRRAVVRGARRPSSFGRRRVPCTP